VNNSYSSLFILVDEHTKNKCLPFFLTKVSPKFDFKIITIPAGENHKNLETCITVWQQLNDLQADRKSVLINIGGGMLTDLGGFVAATYKRGIRFINVSTSLLGMVDASVGGKTGIDFNNLKNHIGLFANPEMVLIDSNFLKTLPKRELVSGMAEIIKYGLSYDASLWDSIKTNKDLNEDILKKWIYRSIEIKSEVVLKDPKEENLRKILNFGHTIGHAIESYFLDSSIKKTLTHGEAIAVGLITECYISSKLFQFPEKELSILKKYIITLFGKINFNQNDYYSILEFMKHDKKNSNGIVQFVLLENISVYKLNCEVDNSLIIEALDYYHL
jgi:3-dehydroquinate synthase